PRPQGRRQRPGRVDTTLSVALSMRLIRNRNLQPVAYRCRTRGKMKRKTANVTHMEVLTDVEHTHAALLCEFHLPQSTLAVAFRETHEVNATGLIAPQACARISIIVKRACEALADAAERVAEPCFPICLAPISCDLDHRRRQRAHVAGQLAGSRP